MIATVRAVLRFLEAIQSFQPNAQPSAQLPDQIRARVMREVIEIRRLAARVVQMRVAISEGRTELLAPAMCVTDRRAPVGQCHEVPRGSERGVTVGKPGVVSKAAHTVAVHAEQLHGVVPAQIQAGAQIEAPAKRMMIVAQPVLGADIAEERAELQMAKVF